MVIIGLELQLEMNVLQVIRCSMYIREDCPYDCMRCCHGRRVCELTTTIAAPAMSGMNDNPLTNVVDKSSESHMFSYILLIGVIAFILINNIFIGCWCLKRIMVV
eukprot:TRINITY_DN1156_c0_g1_i1.p1 TRINITY_DN1156_c0_g1~~TRINITY_DN1156_c0_g1_i1.p1  ORF type:complete len:105 (+),score=8.38 TRINITY_DN1156_c0_g1_i1:112-426(+)